MTRNSEVLKSFVEYCEKNPDLRFWQALSGWSGRFIFAGDDTLPKDTFSWEGKGPDEPRK